MALFVSNISCPTCGKTEGLYRLDDCRWAYCKTHRTKWIAEPIDDDDAYDENEGRRRYTEIGMSTFTYVGPDVERYKAIVRKQSK
jgi:hypothetical protein